ncbi:hypothetical protein [Winogradskyella sp. PC D3.3]
MRQLYFIVLLFLSSLVYGQKSVLLQNVNNRAKELQHRLNKTEDSILFTAERTIYEIMVFNDDFERIIKVKDSEAKISIADIPVGRYAIEVVLKDKLIIITLLRNETYDLKESKPIITNLETKKAEPKLVAHQKPYKSVNLPQTTPFGSENDSGQTNLRLPGKKETPTVFAHPSSLNEDINPKIQSESKKNLSVSTNANAKYWVLYQTNNGSGSEKILKMADQKTVDRMIQKIEIDLKTKTGRFNQLTVWQIYNPTNFVRHKRKNGHNYMNVASDSFNPKPYYQIDNKSKKP